MKVEADKRKTWYEATLGFIAVFAKKIILAFTLT